MTTRLVPIYAGTLAGEPTELVNARELHKFLEVESRFNDWIAIRISEYDFVENQDFISFTENSVKPQGGRPSKEYHITLDMAKELSMVERNAKGKQARRYFIDCEKSLYYNALPSLLSPPSKTMTVPEFRQWQASVKTTLNLAIKTSVESITIITSADDYLDLMMGKNTPDTSKLIKGIESNEPRPATKETLPESHKPRMWRKNEIQQLTAYHEAGLSYEDIGIKLGRSIHSVSNAVYRYVTKGGVA